MTRAKDWANDFRKVLTECRGVFTSKLGGYGAAWVNYRLMTAVDQILIKAERIRSLEEMGENGESPLVNEGRKTEFVGIINYAVIAVLLSRRGAELNRLDAGALIELYDGAAGEAFALMLDKTHDYSDAWLKLEHTTFTDFILARVGRMKRMIKSGAPAGDLTEQLMDTLNYAAFAILREKGEETGV